MPDASAGRFRPRSLRLADGARLLVRADGSILRVEADGTAGRSWATDDPEWSEVAIRFGLRAQATTEIPSGHRIDATKPPRG